VAVETASCNHSLNYQSRCEPISFGMNMSPENRPPNHLFKLVVVASAAFVLTILLMIVTAFASIENPLVRFFNEHGLTLISVEVLLILVCAFAAMWLDGKQTNSPDQSGHDGDDEIPNEQ
jgi:hypothetical protein